jgi:CRISPR-associated protein Csx16
MRKRLVSFLGTGRYEATRHRFPNGREGAETHYVCRALAEFVHADEVAIVATAEAEAMHADGVSAAQRAASLPQPTFHPIPKGEGEAELWRQFQVIKDLLRSPAGTEIIFDVTHAFRSQPFFAAAITAFVRAVDRDPPQIRIFYAAFEARYEGITPVWELTPFIDLVDWAQQMMLFLRTGRSQEIADRTIVLGRDLNRAWAVNREGDPPNLLRLGTTLRDFGRNLETVRTGDILLGKSVGSAADLAVALDTARESAKAVPPLADVLDRLQHEMIEPLLGASDHLASGAGHRALANLARLYRDMGRWAEVAATVREGCITRYGTPAAAFGERNQRRPSVDEAARRDAEGRWNEEERDTARQIAAVRNDIEHAGFKRQPLGADSLQQRLCKLVDEFSALPAVEISGNAASHPVVFVNISNHRSGRWGDAQRQAALSLATEIRDWPFPPVPPDAGASEIADLAAQVAAQLIAAIPGVRYAMVQGEFTLVYALVRSLQHRGVICLSATTRRNVLEADGEAKTTRFEFVRFREYS